MNGTLVPVYDGNVGASSRNHRFSADVQASVDANSRLATAATRRCQAPRRTLTPGARPPHRALPRRDRPGRRRRPRLRNGRAAPQTPTPAPVPSEGTDNAAHRKLRARLEHVIDRMKNKDSRSCAAADTTGTAFTTPTRPSPTRAAVPPHHQKTAMVHSDLIKRSLVQHLVHNLR